MKHGNTSDPSLAPGVTARSVGTFWVDSLGVITGTAEE
jgi:hypothetical protein